MDEKTLKIVFAMFSIGIVASLQYIAWVNNINGAVFAFTSLIIGGIVGSILGFSLRKSG